MSSKMTCPECGNPNAKYYDGALGYEAVRCTKCNTETDLNNPASKSDMKTGQLK